MLRPTLFCLTVMAVAGCETTVNGRLVDGMTNKPIVGYPADKTPCSEIKHSDKEDSGCVEALRVVARSIRPMEGQEGKWEPNNYAGLTCLSFAEDVNPEGRFTMNLCSSKTAYSLETTDSNLFLAEINRLDEGFKGGDLEVKVWRAPKGVGVFRLRDNSLDRISTKVDLQAEWIPNTEEVVTYVKSMSEDDVDLIKADQYLLLTGRSNVEQLSLTPLIRDGHERELGPGDPELMVKLTMPYYVGVAWSADEGIDYSRKTVTIDDSKVILKEKDGHVAKYIRGDAVPPGRYVLGRKEKSRVAILDFGQKLAPAPAEEGGP